MAEDTNKIGTGEPVEDAAEPKTEASKDWQWDASAPMAGDDYLEFAVPAQSEPDAQKAEDEKAEAPEPEEEPAEEAPAAEAGETQETAEPEEDDEPEREDTVPDGCCIICGQKIRHSESELYCNECRSKYMKVDYGASHIILSVIMVFVAVIGIVSFAATQQIAAAIRQGDRYYNQKLYANALDSYDAVSTAADTINERVNAFLQGISTNFNEVKLFNAGTSVQKKRALLQVKTMDIGYEKREALFTTVDTYFTQKELNSEKYKDVKACYDFCKALDDTANAVYEVWYPEIEKIGDAIDENGKLTGKAPDPEAIIAVLDEYIQAHPDAEPSVMEYFKFNTYSYLEYYGVKIKDEDLMQSISAAYEKAGQFGYIYAEPYLVYALKYEKYDEMLKVAGELKNVNPSNDLSYEYLSQGYLAKEDYDKAISVCDDLQRFNPDSLEYYIIKAKALRLKGSFDASIDLCNQGLEQGDDVELQRQLAISYMLSGEEQKALKAATDAYEAAYSAAYNQQSVSLEAMNTSALIAYLCGDEETYEDIKSMLSGNGYELEDSVKAIIKGEKTFEDVFMSGKGDI